MTAIDPLYLRRQAQQTRVIADHMIMGVLREVERGDQTKPWEPVLDRLCRWRDECARYAQTPRRAM